MLVSDTALFGTIGGGNLEYTVTEQARIFLGAGGADYQFQSYALGPLLEQCCGGNVTILLERIEPGAPFLMEARHGVLETRFSTQGSQKKWVDEAIGNGPIYYDNQGGAVDGDVKSAAIMRETVQPTHTLC
jgi:xanthine/CO dehydrogenase XdhC/CoxF family maturation factor